LFSVHRTTRERAEAALGGPGAASGAELTQRWRAEWEAAYPDLDMDWKQLMSRYNYHFGSERRESVDAERTEAAAPRFAYLLLSNLNLKLIRLSVIITLCEKNAITKLVRIRTTVLLWIEEKWRWTWFMKILAHNTMCITASGS
jgi:hypothetical protein